MPKFQCFVTQTTRNTFIIEADDEDDVHEKAIDAFNNAKNLDFDTDCDVQPITPGRKLDRQASEKRLFWHTHFDCWNDDEECDAPTWEWNDQKAIDHVWKLMVDAMDKTDCDDFLKLNIPPYKELGQIQFFDKVEAVFLSLGYDVYNSDTLFEVYHAPKRRATIQSSTHP